MTTTDQQAIDHICDGLGSPPAVDLFRRDLDALLVRWQRIADEQRAGAERGREILAALERGETIEGEIDGTAHLLGGDDGFRSRGAA